MKKLMPVLLAALCCYACGDQPTATDPIKEAPKKAEHATNAAPLFQYGSPVLLQYDRYLNSIDTQLIDMSSQAVDTFKVLFKKESAAVCDTAFYLFDQFHNRVLSFQALKMDSDSIDYLNFFGGYEPDTKPKLTKKEKARKQSLDKNGMHLDLEEGAVYMTQDRQFLATMFSQYVSPGMKQYLVQKAKEQQEGFEADAGIVIEPKTLADRTVWWENFAKANPKFLYAGDAAYWRRLTLYALVMGMDNTSVRAYISDTLALDSLSDYFNTAWKYMQDKHPKTETNAIVAPMYSAWQKRDTAEISKLSAKFDKEWVMSNP